MLASLQRNIIAGIFIVVPVWVTIWVITFLTNLLIEFGSPVASRVGQLVAPHSQFLAAPRQARQEVKQQYRCEKQRGEAGQHQGAAGALADGLLQ